MVRRVFGPLLALPLLAGLAAPGFAAPARKTVVVLPAGYFSADQTSANRVTKGLRGAFQNQGYRVVEPERASVAAANSGINRRQHYSDREVLRVGRRLGADLVAYPRVLALGLGVNARGEDEPAPEAVVLLRVIDVRTGRAVYARQVGEEADLEQSGRRLVLEQGAASATASAAARPYFQRVAGTRQETRPRR